MAKDPDERYPSAGDLGRAAVAGAENRAPSEPPRTVAIGAAAPVESATAEAAPTVGRRSTRSKRWVLVGAVVLAAAVVAVLAIVLVGGGGGSKADSPTSVARAWLAAYNAGDFEKGASYFESGASVNGSRLTNQGQFVDFQSAYKCALRPSSLSAKGTTVTIRAVNVAGPGSAHACKGYVGSTDVIVLRVEGGKITEFSLA
jgi:hypothetical protein